MLKSYKYGYAVMTKDLDAYSFKDMDIEKCKKYCRNGYVVVKQIPYVAGFSIRIMWHDFYKPFCFKFKYHNILWVHWNCNKEYLHKVGDVVYENQI